MYGEITNPSQILGQIDELHPLVGYLNNGIPNVNLHGTGEPTSDIGVDGQIYTRLVLQLLIIRSSTLSATTTCV